MRTLNNKLNDNEDEIDRDGSNGSKRVIQTLKELHMAKTNMIATASQLQEAGNWSRIIRYIHTHYQCMLYCLLMSALFISFYW